METIKLPRKLKKGLKSAILNITPCKNWVSKEVGICGISKLPRHLNNPIVAKFKNIAVDSHRLYPR